MPKRTRGEPTLPLINIVFLMLVFFLAAAQLTRPVGDLSLVRTDDPKVVPPADALILHANGRLVWQGDEVTLDSLPPDIGRLLPDRAAPATAVLDAAQALRSSGAKDVVLITERALP
jgi:biopolymer transport protein ExbD